MIINSLRILLLLKTITILKKVQNFRQFLKKDFFRPLKIVTGQKLE